MELIVGSNNILAYTTFATWLIILQILTSIFTFNVLAVSYLLNIFQHSKIQMNFNNIYIQPLKVYKRHTPTMYMLQHWKENKFHPVTKSTVISEILTGVAHPWLDFSISLIDRWNRVFAKASEIQEDIEKGINRDNTRINLYGDPPRDYSNPSSDVSDNVVMNPCGRQISRGRDQGGTVRSRSSKRR